MTQDNSTQRAIAKQRGTRTARQSESGFTLLELIIVVALIGIIAAIGIPMLKDRPQGAREAVLKNNLLTIRDTLDQHYADRGNYPSSLEELVDLNYLRRVPEDPIMRSSEFWILEYEEIDPELTPAETDLPEDGAAGIIDVHSGSEGTALDGTLYADW